MAGMKSGNRLRAVGMRLGALTLSLAVSLLLVELVLQVHNPFVSRVSHDRIVLPAHQRYELEGIGFRGLDPSIVHVKNSLGFRGGEPPEGEATALIFVGGSTTEMFYQDEPKTWAHRVGARLHPEVPDLWWQNAGLDGHSTFGHRVLVEDYLTRLAPDVVVYMIGTNDVGHESAKSFDREAMRAGVDLRGPVAFVKSLATRSEVAALGVRLYRWNRARSLGLHHDDLQLAELPTVELPDREIAALIERHRLRYHPGFRERVEALVSTTRAFGGEPVLVTQPLLIGAGTDDATGVNLAKIEVDLYEKGLSGEAAWRLLESYNDVTRAVAREQGVALIDVARELPKSSRYFYDPVHFTNDGSAAVAEIIAEGLRPVLRRRTGDARL